MDRLCGSTFWDLNVTWNTENPDFTICFQKTVLIWIPCCFLWIFLPLELYYLRGKNNGTVPFNIFNIIKLVLTFIAILLKLIDVIRKIWIHNFYPIIYVCATAISFLTLVLFFILTFANIKKGIRSSGILFIFSLLSMICGIPEIRTTINNGYHFFDFVERDVENISYTLYYVCMTTIFLLNCFADGTNDRSDQSPHTDAKRTYPSKNASFLSKLFLIWFDVYVWKSYKQKVPSYLWDLNLKDSTKDIFARQKSILKKKHDSTKISILSMLQKEHGPFFWLCALLRTSFELLTTGLFIIFDWLLLNLQKDEPIMWKAYTYTALFFINILVQSTLMTKYAENCCRVEIRVRSTVTSALYKKVLHISNAVRKEFATSDIVNLMSIDTFQLQNAIRIFHYLIALISQMIVSYVYLWYLLGFSIITNVLVIIAIFSSGYQLTKRMKVLQKEEANNKNIRSKFLQEIISGIKVLKMYAWELSFKKVAFNLRQQENKTLNKIASTNVLFQILFQNSPFISCLVAYMSYILTNQNVMDIRTAFVSFVIFNYFRIAFNHIPQQLLFLQQVRISIKRMNEFLNSEELDDSAISHDLTVERLIMRNASFSWISKNGPRLLDDINIKIDDLLLVAIVGPVGSGKSSLISAFLGEMYKTSGYVNVKGKTAYVPQQSWILNSSIKENINFGDIVDNEIYKKAVEACALNPDFNELTDGDLTEIGEKGVNLSGGQKQRISLARAICQNADIYFFDDPLSAVDTKVASHIFRNVLGPEGVLKHKTRILVTHNIKFLPLTDKIILLEDGRISEMGTYQELLAKEEFADFVRSNVETEKTSRECILNDNKETNENHDQSIQPNSESDAKSHSLANYKPSAYKLIKEEPVKCKQIEMKLYWIYFKASGRFLSFIALLMFVIFQTSVMFSNVFLSNWITSKDSFETKYSFLIIFAAYGITQVAVICLGSYIFFIVSVKAGTYFYHNLLNKILRWPMSSFDSTPIGRIITRISDDVYTLDNYLAIKMIAFFAIFIRYLSIFTFTVILVPICCFAIIPLNIAYLILRKYYVGLSHQLKRIETIHKSPLYSHIVETVTGIQTIRAYGFQEKFTSRCYERNDLYSASYHSSIICTRWFCSRVELIEALLLCSITISVLLERNSLTIGHIGLIIALAIQMIRGIGYMSDVFNEIEDGIMSVERISEYLGLPEEPEWDKSLIQVSEKWPEKGEITFQNYKLKYREDLDLVLKGISFTVESGEKIGIVGRTGAGKTSIIQGLFRIVEPADGTIYIDNIDITKVGLHTLRSKLTVIPQDPVLFYGTLRFNLDPFHDYQDEYLWDILEKSHLKNFVKELPGSLQYIIEEGGQNLSFGQRQLICLARALLRKSKILVLDEATASVDVRTDELIQKTIREEFSHCTVITIAHRLHTLQDYDKILILERGNMVNFVSTENLNPQFCDIAFESGLLV